MSGIVGIERRRAGSSWCDFDRTRSRLLRREQDGTHDSDVGNQFWLNEGDGTFTEIAAALASTIMRPCNSPVRLRRRRMDTSPLDGQGVERRELLQERRDSHSSTSPTTEPVSESTRWALRSATSIATDIWTSTARTSSGNPVHEPRVPPSMSSRSSAASALMPRGGTHFSFRQRHRSRSLGRNMSDGYGMNRPPDDRRGRDAGRGR